MAGYDASAHLSDDLFANRLAFVVLLNFPLTTLQQRLTEGDTWSLPSVSGQTAPSQSSSSFKAYSWNKTIEESNAEFLATLDNTPDHAWFTPLHLRKAA
jgi:hypothetical protein